MAAAIFGRQDRFLRQLDEGLKAELHARGGELTICGDEKEVREAENVLRHLTTLASAGVEISALTVNYALASRQEEDPVPPVC